jgi:LacI family transcriptional regulator
MPSRRRSASRKTSILDVARKAGVSLGTASRVINQHPSVSQDKRDRVQQAIDELGYVPDKVAQSMRSRRSMTFACVMRDFTVPVLSTFVDAMQREIDAYGFSLMVASSYHDPQRELALLQGFEQRRIDGLVIASSSETDAPLLAAMKAVNFPIVLIDRDAPAELDRVMINHAQGMVDAVHHLASLGHQAIALITGDPGLHPTRHRLQGYRQGMRACQLPVKSTWVRAVSFGADVGYHETLRLLDSAHPPTAIIAGGSALLPGVLRAAHERRLRIPQDLSVIAGADSDLASLSIPAITAIRWGHDELGRAAGQFLINRLHTPSLVAQQHQVDAELVLRGSCASPSKRSARSPRQTPR